LSQFAGARILREAAGLTQEELANKAGLTAKAASLLERGVRRFPHPHTVRSLADAAELPGQERASFLAAVPILCAPPTPLVGREREVKELRVRRAV